MRTTAVPAVEQKQLPEQIADIIVIVVKTFWTSKQRMAKQTIEDVLYPARAFERNHPKSNCRILNIWKSLTVRTEPRKILSASSAR
jgi:hypothetical protein